MRGEDTKRILELNDDDDFILKPGIASEEDIIKEMVSRTGIDEYKIRAFSKQFKRTLLKKMDDPDVLMINLFPIGHLTVNSGELRRNIAKIEKENRKKKKKSDASLDRLKKKLENIEVIADELMRERKNVPFFNKIIFLWRNSSYYRKLNGMSPQDFQNTWFTKKDNL